MRYSGGMSGGNGTGLRRLAMAVGIVWAVTGWGSPAETGRAVLEGTNVIAVGRLATTERRTVRVRLKNEGTAPLRLLHVIATCRCLWIDAYPEAIKPGGTGVIAATLDGADLSGAFERALFVETDDPVTRLIKIKLVGEAVPPEKEKAGP